MTDKKLFDAASQKLQQGKKKKGPLWYKRTEKGIRKDLEKRLGPLKL